MKILQMCPHPSINLPTSSPTHALTPPDVCVHSIIFTPRCSILRRFMTTSGQTKPKAGRRKVIIINITMVTMTHLPEACLCCWKIAKVGKPLHPFVSGKWLTMKNQPAPYDCHRTAATLLSTPRPPRLRDDSLLYLWHGHTQTFLLYLNVLIVQDSEPAIPCCCCFVLGMITWETRWMER